MKIKVIIEDGIVRAVLKNHDVPVHVELIDTSDSYSDSKVEKYAQSFFLDPGYISCDYSVADFDEFEALM